ncbi:MAG: MauE/DoxX family redox-associated membrane protein, partial [Dehalococcoidia bacterium]
MDAALFVARLLLAAVFVVAGITKLLDRTGTRTAVAAFGVPSWLVPAVAWLLPFTELAVAVALLPVASAWAGGIAALALLGLFSTAIAVSLARGRTPDCHCFGQVSGGPIGAETLLRNALLAVVAGFLVVQGHTHAGADVLGHYADLAAASQASLAIALGGLAVAGAALWLLLELLAQNGRLLVRLDALEQAVSGSGAGAPALAVVPTAAEAPPAGLPVSAPAPAFTLTGLFGETLTLDALRAAGRPLLLAFTDPGCGPCSALLPDVARWQRELGATVSLALISRGSIADNRAKATEHGLSQVLLQQDREVNAAYQVNGTPSAVLVRADGTIGSPLAEGAEPIKALVARTLGTPLPAAPQSVIPGLPVAPAGQPCPNCGQVHDAAPAQAPAVQGLAVGTPAPVLQLPDLDGKPVDLAELRGQET